MSSGEASARPNGILQAKSIQGLVLIALGGFFLHRYLAVRTSSYLVLVIVLLSLGLCSICNMLPRRIQSLALNLAISLVFLDFVFSQVDLQRMMEAFRGLNYLFLLPSTALIVLSFIIRAYRWGWFFPPDQPVSFMSLLSALSIGVAANQVLPARAGEFVRAYVLGRRERLSKVTAFATIVLERVFDGLTILFFLLLVVLLIGVQSPEIHYMGVAGAIFYVVTIAAVLLVYFQESMLERWIHRLLPNSSREKAVGLLRAFAGGLESIRSARQLVMILVLSLFLWVVIALSFWPVLTAFDFGVPVPFYTPFLLVATVGLGLMIPAAPAGIGVFQYSCLLTLQIVFAPYADSLAADFNEQAAAFSLVAHLSQVGPEIVMGLIFFLVEGLNLREVRSEL
jgi:uncharacterized protein (TIRG00374 family)